MLDTSSTDINQVTAGGFCIGCGACAVNNPAIQISPTPFGLYQATLATPGQASIPDVCPFSSLKDEDYFGSKLFGDSPGFDRRIGYFRALYAGHVSESEFRRNGSSGGLVTWVLSQLLSEGDIDAVIHVGSTGNQSELFSFRISETHEDIRAHAKSRYYPVHMDEVMAKVLDSDKRYAFVGVPCFVKAVRLMCESNAALAERIRFCIAIFCGHLKSKSFAEMIAWQQNVAPSQLADINFRAKSTSGSANRYGVQVAQATADGVSRLQPVPTRNLFGMDWGLGYFKPKACDWCDDIAGETADLACGDAWLPAYVGDPAGSNIVVVRHERIAQLIAEGIADDRLALTEQTVEAVYQSQAGNYRHRQEGLSVRINEADTRKEWHPPKRIQADSFQVSEHRKRIYAFRTALAKRSHEVFFEAKQRSSFLYFYRKMLPMELRYFRLNGNLLKGMTKSAFVFAQYVARRMRA